MRNFISIAVFFFTFYIFFYISQLVVNRFTLTRPIEIVFSFLGLGIGFMVSLVMALLVRGRIR